jgi:nucleoside-diphosphate-sugar epimerase
VSGGRRRSRRAPYLFCPDLNADEGWAEAAAGCDYVLHVASPYPITVQRDENELIMPARDGALRVLRAAREVGVKRVVLTSSFAAIGYGARGRTNAFTEEDWTNPNDSSLQPYQKSKTIAERAAWDFIARVGASWNWLCSTLSVFSGPSRGQTIQPRSCS